MERKEKVEDRKKERKQKKKGGKGSKKLVDKFCLRHTLEIYKGKRIQNFRGVGKESNLRIYSSALQANCDGPLDQVCWMKAG